VDSLTSNTGHLLWSGVIESGRAEQVVERLTGNDMFTGWGLRTMSSKNTAFNPISYHNGSVWPHDTGIAAEGMRRYGFPDQADRLLKAIFESAGHFDYRLPEVFGGFARAQTQVPVEYPTASRPQAWSAGSALLALRTLLGLDASGGFSYQPRGQDDDLQLSLSDVPFRGELLSAG
jgi:glycogen debranching enzyme